MNFKKELAEVIAQAAGIAPEECAAYIEVPPQEGNGRFCLSLF